MSYELFAGSVEGKSQADGAQIISLGAYDRFREHQIQLEVSATPGAGTLTVGVKTPGASTFVTVDTIDMTDAADYIARFSGYAAAFQFTPNSFDAGKTYSVYVCSGAGE